jgi:hypothetical protein
MAAVDVTWRVAKLNEQLGPEVTSHAAKLNERLARYIPARETWNPADEALFLPNDLYRVPPAEAHAMQLKAIKYAFTRHYDNNGFYHEYCTTRGVSPGDIKTVDDLFKIPLIPDLTFKQYPEGKDFARWIARVFTGDLPKVVIKGSHPTFDQVISGFNASGLAVTYSSGTSGRFTFIPRDQKTFLAGQYALAKSVINMWTGDLFETHGYLLLPNPAKTSVFVGKVTSVYFDTTKSAQIAIDRKLTTKDIQTAMTSGGGLKGRIFSYVQSRIQQKMIDQIILWLEWHDKVGEKISLVGAPYLLYFVLNKLQADGKSFDFNADSLVITGGGWKVHENVRMRGKDFRKQVHDVLGIPETNCLDLYGMVEWNEFTVQCPEGHYLHVPYTVCKPIVLNDDLMPAQEGESGRFAFLDALAGSYPGFIITGDQVRMFEHCPVCDRPGPVLEPEIRRAKGEEVRGCAEELRRTLARDFSGD